MIQPTEPIGIDAVLAAAAKPGWWTMNRPAVEVLVAEVERLTAALATARAAVFHEAARVLEDTGRDDDAVNLLDNIAHGITTRPAQDGPQTPA